jgi:hypothetical protein
MLVREGGGWGGERRKEGRKEGMNITCTQEFKTNLGNTGRPHLKKEKKKMRAGSVGRLSDGMCTLHV